MPPANNIGQVIAIVVSVLLVIGLAIVVTVAIVFTRRKRKQLSNNKVRLFCPCTTETYYFHTLFFIIFKIEFNSPSMQ